MITTVQNGAFWRARITSCTGIRWTWGAGFKWGLDYWGDGGGIGKLAGVKPNQPISPTAAPLPRGGRIEYDQVKPTGQSGTHNLIINRRHHQLQLQLPLPYRIRPHICPHAWPRCLVTCPSLSSPSLSQMPLPTNNK